jgi:hypothetical protein
LARRIVLNLPTRKNRFQKVDENNPIYNPTNKPQMHSQYFITQKKLFKKKIDFLLAISNKTTHKKN